MESARSLFVTGALKCCRDHSLDERSLAVPLGCVLAAAHRLAQDLGLTEI